jgi:predicted permease
MLSSFRTFASRLYGWLRSSRLDADFDEELHAHLAMLIDENVRRGMTPDAAARAARLTLGGSTQISERQREQRGLPLLDGLIQDIRYALRVFRRSPGFTSVAILTLALGIGVNTTVFTLFDAVALKALPVDDAGRMVRCERWFARGARGDLQYAFSFAEYLHYRSHSQTFAGVIGASWPIRVATDGEPVQAQAVSGNYFSVLGVNAVLGRTFLAEEDQQPGAHPVIVLSDSFWRRWFHADPHVLGKTVTLNNDVFTVIGVAPAEFIGTGNPPQVPDLWAPLAMQAQLDPGFAWLDRPGIHRIQVLARLAPAATRAQAQAEVQVLSRQIEEVPEGSGGQGKTIAVTLQPATYFGGTDDARFQAMVALFMALVGMILIVACVNLANMLLARASVRQREIGVRLALGASRGRLIRQLLTETVLLAIMGGAAAIVLSTWATEALWIAVDRMIRLMMFGGSDVPFAASLRPDTAVFAFVFGVSLATGIVFGLSPALQLTHADVSAALKEQGTSFGHRLSRSRLRALLLAIQVAVSMMFLISGGLLMRGLLRSQTADPGFDPRRVWMVLVNFGPDPVKSVALQARLIDQLRHAPELDGVAHVDRFPLAGTWSPPVAPEDTQASPQQLPARTLANHVSPGYFETVGIAIRRGRNFTQTEGEVGAPVAIVSEAAARHLWPGDDPIGKHLKLDLDFRGTMARFEVVGVANDVRTANLSRVDPAFVYLTTKSSTIYNLLVRSRGDARTTAAAVRAAVESIDKRLVPSLGIMSLADGPLRVQRLMPQVTATCAAVLAGLALLLAVAGIYGVMSYLVSQRVREIGIRMALGATAADVLRMVVRQGLSPVGAGAAVGVVAAAAVSSVLRSTLVSPSNPDLLFGIGAFDPVTFVGVGGLLAFVAALASWIPARRAMTVDPMTALRCE